MNKIIYLAFLGILLGFAPAKKKSIETRAFSIFDKTGKEIEFDKVVNELVKADVLFFGEYHNNPICHWLQLRLVKMAHDLKKDQVCLAAEMFEADGQTIFDEYLNGKISEKTFESEMRLWPNYKTDYKPLVLFAKENKLAFVAANIPRRYANMVYTGGFEALYVINEEAKKWIAPLPIAFDAELGCYKKMKEMSGGHGGDNILKSQAIKDATMAWFIHKNFKPGKLIIHFNGSWHSDNYEGIQWYLKSYNKEIKLSSITTVSQKEVSKLESENKGLADFIIVVADDMTTTH